jgi:4-hydroxybenzoate polyprenyltransferase
MNEEVQKAFLCRFWQYQAERFPFVQHGPLIAVFVLSGQMLSAALRGVPQWPDFGTWLAAACCVFLLFLQLRIADEFKDAETDARYRPERPVPRGLVSLKELRNLAVLTGIVQLLLSWLASPGLIVILLLVWAYMALMTAEFFVGSWLSQRLGLYMLSHMIIMPLVDFFITAFDWIPHGQRPSAWLTFFLIISFANGVVLEIGRKTWAPTMERKGVESYSSIWGINKACFFWAIALLTSAVGMLVLALKLNVGTITIATVVPIALLMGLFASYFTRHSTDQSSKKLVMLSGLWVFISYLWLGPVFRWLGAQ